MCTRASAMMLLACLCATGCDSASDGMESSAAVADECGERCAGMVRISPGVVRVGSPDGEGSAREHPQVLITFDAPFWIDRYEVTNAQYREFLLANGNVCTRGGVEYPCHDCFEFAKQDSGLDCDSGFDIKFACQASPGGSATESCADHPVVSITPAGAHAYCEALGKTLPTEAEWERVANGPAEASGEPWYRFAWGNECPAGFNAGGDPLVGELTGCQADEWSVETARANCDEASCRDGFERTSPVDAFPAGDTPEGVSGMAGNVLERVADCYHANYAVGDGPPRDGSVWNTDCEGQFTIARGSGFGDEGAALRSRARTDQVDPGSADPDVGFRCVARPTR